MSTHRKSADTADRSTSGHPNTRRHPQRSRVVHDIVFRLPHVLHQCRPPSESALSVGRLLHARRADQQRCGQAVSCGRSANATGEHTQQTLCHPTIEQDTCASEGQAHLPVIPLRGALEAAQQRHGAPQRRHLLRADGREAVVAQRTGQGVVPQPCGRQWSYRPSVVSEACLMLLLAVVQTDAEDMTKGNSGLARLRKYTQLPHGAAPPDPGPDPGPDPEPAPPFVCFGTPW